ncbi:hypothetical protein GCM10027605_27720 [Micromonospora zhanjiangensis]
MQTWMQLALVGVLVIVNAAFSGSEMALVSLRESQLQRLERRSRAGRVLARLAKDPNRFLATIQIGITLAGFLASAAAAVSLARPLVSLLAVLGTAAEPVAIVLVTLALTFVTLVFGELAPKRIAMQRAERWALVVARPLDLLASLSRPAVWALGVTTDLVVRLAGVDPKPQRDEISPDELRDIVSGHHGLTLEQQTIIAGAVEIAERRLRAVLVPRLQVFCLDSGTSAEAARIVLAASGNSRPRWSGTACSTTRSAWCTCGTWSACRTTGRSTTTPDRRCCCRTRCRWSRRCASSRPNGSTSPWWSTSAARWTAS